MTSTIDTFIYLQRDIEHSLQRLENSSFVHGQDSTQLLHHLSCTLDDLEEVHRLLPSDDPTTSINEKNSSTVTFAKLPSFNEREEYLRRMRKQLQSYQKKKTAPMEIIRLDPPLDEENEDQIIRKQDEQLDSIHQSIVSLKHLTQNIHSEIDDHLRVLDNLESDMVQNQSRVENLTRRTKHFLERSGDGVGGHTCLFSIAVLLFFAIIVLMLFF